MMNQIRLSPSKLNEFNACPRCFYDAYALKIKKPRGIFPSLPGGMDKVLKKHFDHFRGINIMPSEIKSQVEGVLLKDQERLDKWRNWRSGMSYTDTENDIFLRGAIDECVVCRKQSANLVMDHYIPLDYKTKGEEPKDSGVQYYQTQLDCYNLMLSAEGLETMGVGYLVYVYPVETTESLGEAIDIMLVKFGVKVFKIPCSIDRAKEVVRKAAECLRGERPRASLDCEQCIYCELKSIQAKK